MSALTDRIAAEHHVYRTYVHDDLACTGCDFAWQRSASDVANGTLDGTAVQEAAAAHIAAVTEAAVREHIAAALDDLARARHDDLKETKRRTRAESFAGASAMAYELAARIARGEQ